MQTVPHLDLHPCQSKWYEIVRLPLHWENKRASDVTATCTLRLDGKIAVLNQCKKSGSFRSLSAPGRTSSSAA
jgi:apolipoprotein D and lipocalin family protein